MGEHVVPLTRAHALCDKAEDERDLVPREGRHGVAGKRSPLLGRQAFGAEGKQLTFVAPSSQTLSRRTEVMRRSLLPSQEAIPNRPGGLLISFRGYLVTVRDPPGPPDDLMFNVGGVQGEATVRVDGTLRQ